MVWVTIHGVGACRSLALPAQCMEKDILRAIASAVPLRPGMFYLKMGRRLLNNWTSDAMRQVAPDAELHVCMRLRGGDPQRDTMDRLAQEMAQLQASINL
eukprot:899800-Prorocentrum_lima.AAC.1